MLQPDFGLPAGKALELVSFFKDRRTGFVDILIEEFAGQRGELRLAVTPSLVQHVGLESSKRTGTHRLLKRGSGTSDLSTLTLNN